MASRDGLPGHVGVPAPRRGPPPACECIRALAGESSQSLLVGHSKGVVSSGDPGFVGGVPSGGDAFGTVEVTRHATLQTQSRTDFRDRQRQQCDELRSARTVEVDVRLPSIAAWRLDPPRCSSSSSSRQIESNLLRGPFTVMGTPAPPKSAAPSGGRRLAPFVGSASAAFWLTIGECHPPTFIPRPCERLRQRGSRRCPQPGLPHVRPCDRVVNSTRAARRSVLWSGTRMSFVCTQGEWHREHRTRTQRRFPSVIFPGEMAVAALASQMGARCPGRIGVLAWVLASVGVFLGLVVGPGLVFALEGYFQSGVTALQPLLSLSATPAWWIIAIMSFVLALGLAIGAGWIVVHDSSPTTYLSYLWRGVLLVAVVGFALYVVVLILRVTLG